ncbi:hypothetical protein M426DRAFT_8256 [Hypoxylon sp. CI-4A]|nr:hypothetical protein M426DRAFT_8256 [Hypoxylon sp. CI-4A]
MATPTATATDSTGTSTATSSTAAPSISVLTLTVRPLTTTFTPPASCAEMRLTQLSSPGYQIWLNEPQPVPGSKFADCYPSEFMAGYTSGYLSRDIAMGTGSLVVNASSSIAPVLSPLVCPQGWNAVRTWDSGYIACCASGYQLHPPDTTLDSNRPAYGGTCFSAFEAGKTVRVTAYDSASVTATVEWAPTGTTDQAYAHPIDGFLAGSDDSTSTHKLSGGAIAGIVIGSIVGFLAILLALYFPLRRYYQKRRSTASLENPDLPPQQNNTQIQYNKELPGSPVTGYMQSPYDTSTSATFISRSPSYKTEAQPQPYELECQQPRELDSGWAGRELEARDIPNRPQG